MCVQTPPTYRQHGKLEASQLRIPASTKLTTLHFSASLATLRARILAQQFEPAWFRREATASNSVVQIELPPGKERKTHVTNSYGDVLLDETLNPSL